MKKIFFLMALSYFFCLSSAAQSNIESELRNLSLVQFLNKPIDTLLAHIPHTDSLFVGSSDPILKGATLYVEYDSLWLHIKVYDLQYINPYRTSTWVKPEIAWPLHLLRKEKVWQITVYKADATKVFIINFAELE